MSWFWSLGPQPRAAIIAALVGAVFGLIGGIIGPIVQGKVRQAADVAQLRMQADLARQAKLIDAQDVFLADMTQALWKWRYASIRVAYYGSSGREDMYANAWKEYDAEIWDYLNNVRTLISRSRRLVSNNIFHELRKFYPVMVELDKAISATAGSDETTTRANMFSSLNDQIYNEISIMIDDLLLKIGTDFGLSYYNQTSLDRKVQGR